MSEEGEQGRQEWLDGMEVRLATIGIGREETLGSIITKIETAGLKIVALREDPGRSFSTYSLYYAQVSERDHPDAVVGAHYSTVDYADALSWATSRVLEHREEHQSDRPERNSPKSRS